MRYFSFLLVLFFQYVQLDAQTFNGTSGTFSANNTTYFDLNINSLTPSTLSNSFGIESVRVSLNCDDTHNISLILVAPNNKEVILSHYITWGTTYYYTTFKDNASVYINELWGNYNGTFRPDENLGVLNNGLNGNGNWRLKIVNKNYTSGTLSNWNLKFSNTPSPFIAFTNSNLPLVLINTNGQLIQDDPKIDATMQIINNTNGINSLTDTPSMTTNIGIEFRGQSSMGVAKKSYGITTRDVNGVDTNLSIFGMPAEEDWVLIANYNDKTLIRNALAYELARQSGRYASRTQFCEVFINGQYRGVYNFGEKIKRDNNRVNIAKLEPNENSGEDLTGGYIIKIDKENWGDASFTSPYSPINSYNGQTIKYIYEYPKSDEISNEQKLYIQDYVINNFESKLNGTNFTDPSLGYRPYIEETSFMDYFFINEISKNIDGYRISTFMHKNKNGELVMGPVWDYDLAFRNADYCEGELYTGWAFQFPCGYDGYQPPFWWTKFFQDDYYCHDMHNRWVNYRQNIFATSHIMNLVDTMSNQLQSAQVRNFQKWNTMGRYIWPNPSPIPATYAEEISSMKTWITNRLDWLDGNLPNPQVAGLDDLSDVNWVSINPNVIENKELHLVLSSSMNEYQIQIFDTRGNNVLNYQNTQNDSENIIEVNNLQSGIYFCKIINGEQNTVKKIIVK